ncbi:MAG: YraN family protein [Chloroflexi bacterium]|nr:YraN family protein [Chloroflexota bacterium]
MPILHNPFRKHITTIADSTNRKQTGSSGEALAIKHLRKHGYKIIETNFRCRYGEIDIIATKNDYLVFIEVRAKKNLGFGSPEESITAIKKERLVSLAEYYLQTHKKLPPQWRIDVVPVELDSGNRVTRIEIIENAIEE